MFQFIHVDSYAREAGKGKAGRNTVSRVAAEADRIEGNCPHVEAPKPPRILHGVSAKEAAKLATEWADNSKDGAGRRIRKDGLCLAAGVISYKNTGENWEEFRADCVDWLKEKYGVRLKSVIEHTDEEHPHLHFYLVPLPGERFEAVHAGKAAATEAKASGALKGGQNLAYNEGMRAFQDEFSREVAMGHGMTRIGPGRRRLTTAAWNKEQQQAEFFANASAVHEEAKNAGFKKGRALAKIELEKLKKEAQKLPATVAQAVGTFAKSILANWHEPSKQAKKQAEDAELVAQRALDSKRKLEERVKSDNSIIEKQTRDELDKLKRVNTNFEADLKTAHQTIEQLNEELAYLRRTKPKDGYKH